jgi:hypothetical protein
MTTVKLFIGLGVSLLAFVVMKGVGFVTTIFLFVASMLM